MGPVALRCRDLVKRYPGVIAVNGLHLEVAVGECFGLLGPNGAGKTTTVEIFEGLLAPDAGRVEILGQQPGARNLRLRQRLGVQLQEARFSEKLSVLETIALFRSFYSDGSDPRDVLRRVDLEDKAGAWVGKLSGGQRQRLSLACALVGDPELLFLDEPTSGLDPQSRRKIWEIIEEFRGRGRTVLLTTHYMEEAERLCDRVAIVDHGSVIASGTPQELIGSLGGDHVVEFETRGFPSLDRLARLEGVESVVVEQGAVMLTAREVHQVVPALLDELERQRLSLTRLTTHHATLEDVFVSLTGRHLRDS